MFTFISRGEIHARVGALGTAANAVQAEIHLCACSILEHTREHGDYTAGELLMNSLPNGQRVKALAAWFREFSNGKLAFKRDPKSGSWAGDLAKGRTDADFRVDEAIVTSFADLTKEVDPSSITVKGIIKQISQRANDTEMHKDGVTPKVTPEARVLAAKLMVFIRENSLDKVA
jgi:hypothetical protein